jgi:hypothetical protein
MDFVDLLLNPIAAIGCAIGIGLAAGLRWLFPNEDLVLVQALLIVFCTGIGVAVQLRVAPPSTGRDDKE